MGNGRSEKGRCREGEAWEGKGWKGRRLGGVSYRGAAVQWRECNRKVNLS